MKDVCLSIQGTESSLVITITEPYFFIVFFHIAAKIGEGILLDHGTGVVLGETAIIGNRVPLMHVSVFLH